MTDGSAVGKLSLHPHALDVYVRMNYMQHNTLSVRDGSRKAVDVRRRMMLQRRRCDMPAYARKLHSSCLSHF